MPNLEELTLNRRAVWEAIKADPAASVFDIMAVVSLSRETIYRHIRWLNKHGFEPRYQPRRPGRPRKFA